ncbi:Alkyl hydroperoxide reductase AhpD [Alphaproteobacteria bacterium SO-S41]|nr:Alkyl hydroperoxide reductase AhpD [Alphaproteobacteria bacterium SO-S41]
MSLETLRNALPEYAKDIKLNLGTLAAEPILTEQQRYGAFIAAALASRNAQVSAALIAEFGPKLSAEALEAAKTSAAIMAMTNIYYRFTHLVSNEDYAKLPAKLRMNALGKPLVDKIDFELWSIAVSAVNGCGMCLDSHEKVVRAHGVSTEAVQAAVRIAAVVHAAAAILDGEDAIRNAAPAQLAAE